MNADQLTPYRTLCQLLCALESARNQLAVAIALESKRTTPEKWNGYIETGQRVVRCLRQLRCGTVARDACPQWRSALELLRAPPVPDEDKGMSEASRICNCLERVLALLQSGEITRM